MKRSASEPGLSNALQAVTPCTKLKRRSKILTLCYLTYLVFYSKLFTFYALLVFYVTLRSILTSKGNKENLSGLNLLRVTSHMYDRYLCHIHVDGS